MSESTSGAGLEQADRDEKRWNQAIDWLINSRYCADSDVQTMFWAIVDGHHPREGIEAADLSALRLIMDVNP